MIVPSVRTSSARRERPLVLFVDDNLDQLELYAMVLERHVDVLKASRGESGYALACGELPDVIVLDIMLPDSNGLQLSQLLRSNPQTSRIPIVFLTGDDAAFRNAHVSPHRLAAFEILKKPCPADRLLATIEAAAGNGFQS